MLDLVHRLAAAREAPFFADSNLTVLTELLRFQQPRIVDRGEVLWAQGNAVESMALILDGGLMSACDQAATLHPAGSMLGAWEIFSQQPRRETARAIETSRIIEIDRMLFIDVMEDHFEFAIDYLQKLCRRLVELRTGRPLEQGI